MNQEVRTLFHELADLSPEQREAYFRFRTIARELRAEVEQLLNFDSRSSETVPACVASSAQQLLQANSGAADAGRYGPYQLQRLLGTGGMGAVYLAERVDGEVKHRVAIKLLRHGPEQPTFLDRFLRERQILASLIHHGIARLLDAGRTADSRPYLVMEYIDGEPIDSYVKQLEVRRKIELFLRVCDAVSYAHRNLIIHRDIKPSNILVDSSGEPKLLDFGIAKILDSPVDQTGTRERWLTPEYASPEQIIGRVQTTATDIYSLGAVLYKLLTGHAPHSSGKSTQEEIVAAIGSEDPLPVSRINPDVPRDLDYIVAMALRKEPGERYASVEAFANDLRAFIEWRPIRARSGNTWYRARRLARRHWAPFTAAAVAFVSLSVGLTVAVYQRNLAERRFHTVRQIANELFNVEQDINSLSGSTAARERIVRTTLQYLESLSKDAGRDLSLKAEIASGYRKVAEIQGVYGHPNLGHPVEAYASLRKAEAIFRELWKAKPDNRQALRGLIETVNFEARIDSATLDLKQLGGRVAELRSLLNVYEPQATATAPEWSFLASSYDAMSSSDLQMNRTDEAAAFALRSTEYRRKVVQEEKSINARGNLSVSLRTYSRICRKQGKLEEFIQAENESIALIEGVLAEQPNHFKARVNLATGLTDLGRTVGGGDTPNLGRVDLAVAYFERALQIGRELIASDPNEVTTRFNQSVADWRLGDTIRDQNPVRALAAYDEAINLLRATTAKNFTRDIPLLSVLAESTFPLRRLNREKEARQRLQEAQRIAAPYRRDRRSPASQSCSEVLSRVEADWALASGRPLEAVALHREYLAELEADPADLDATHDFTSAFLLTRRYQLLAGALRTAGLEGEAVQAESRRHELVETWKKNLPRNPSVEAALMR